MYANSYYYITKAKAIIKGGSSFPDINGEVLFEETPDGVMVTAKINGLPRVQNACQGSFFGFHIHSGTSCSGTKKDEFANAGPHYSKFKCPHPFHSGDLPPLLENNGYSYMRVLVNKFRIIDIIGRVVVIHDMADDFTSQPSGNSGQKIACGRITI